MSSKLPFQKLVWLLTLVLGSWQIRGAETNPTPAELKLQATNTQDMLRGYLQLQEQIHAAQLAIDQTRQESKEAAEQTANALLTRLKALEETMTASRARELELLKASNTVMQNSNRNMFVVGAAFAVIGFLAVLSMAYFQWRAVHRLAEISAILPAVPHLGAGPVMAALGPGEASVHGAGAAEQSNLKLLDALQRLEKRLLELEHTAGTEPTKDEAPPVAALSGATPGNGNGERATGAPAPEPATEAAKPAEQESIDVLLKKGQAMLDDDRAEAALECFDEVLAIEPRHTDALVKKGAALERLHKLEEAVECYDRALAADDKLTIAYLHKGGLFNRMERFNEALECYEKALRTQEKDSADAAPGAA